jgi:ADP-heptose:LPS heptosyltransferase
MIVSRIAKPNRILIVALDNLGDLVFASALTPPLRAAFPDAIIDVWSKTYTAAVARLVPDVGTVIHSDPFWAVRRGGPRPRIKPVLDAVGEVRRRRYDVAILSAAPWRTAAAVAASRIPVRIGLARHRNRFFLTHVLPPEDKHRSVLLEQARLLEPLGIASAQPRYVLDAGPLAETRGRLARVLPDRFVALHPFASSRDRCVPLGEWTQVAFALAARKLPVLWIGTTDDLHELRTMTLPKGVYIDQISDGSLTTTAAALSLASVFAGHDSGPLHVAGALGAPVVGVFAPGEPERTFPQGVGPSRMIARARPADISAADIVRELDALQVPSAV